MKLPATARFCEDCQSLFFHPATCPGCGGDGEGVITARRTLKYRNKPTTVDGIWFASKREAQRWSELRAMQSAGYLSLLRRQVPFPLKVGDILVTTYVADFYYLNNDAQFVVEDAKGVKTEAYKIKKKLLLALGGVAIREV